jgi:hypothetical protein
MGANYRQASLKFFPGHFEKHNKTPSGPKLLIAHDSSEFFQYKSFTSRFLVIVIKN